MKKSFRKLVCGMMAVMAMAIFGVMTSGGAFATVMTVSPMNERIILVPGETYSGSFVVSNPASSTEMLDFTVSAEPFYVDENYDIFYETEGDYNQIVDWTTIENPDGEVEPNSNITIQYHIDVPEDAPAGGQYMSLTTTANGGGEASEGINITSVSRIAHIVYAEIAGTSTHGGEITDINVPGFIFSGNLSATFSIKNTGNVHGKSKNILKVFPLFSDEEVYTNEENPSEKTILPDRTLYGETSWPNTPKIGIFNVVYTVEFEGVTKELSKMVIICPIWLLFVIIFAVALLIFWLVARKKKR